MSSKKDSLEKLHAIYKQIPTVKCKEGCSECCGIVPFLDIEWNKLDNPKKPWFTGTTCNFLKDGKCSIYDNRPFMCRLFATCDEEPLLRCPFKKPSKLLLSKEKSQHLKEQYSKLGKLVR